MKITELSKQNSLLSQFLMEVRDKEIQKDSLRFRKNIERIGELMAYEISKELEYKEVKIITPMAETKSHMLKSQPVIASVLRAGLPFHQGFLNFFDRAENAFISAFRKHTTAEDFTIQLDYVSTPDLNSKTLLLVDPMLATAKSLVQVFKALKEFGTAQNTHLAAVIAARPGIEYLKQELQGEHVQLWVAAVDPELDERSYIVPGLGDAGDLAYGSKIDL